MSPQNDDLTPKDYPEQRKLRGLYRHVKISVKTLDRIILVGIIAIVVAIFIAIRQGGYTVTFDSNGGTDVPAQELRYGELVTEPQEPTREGYSFGGWYSDEAFGSPWDFSTAVGDSMELYAKWVPQS